MGASLLWSQTGRTGVLLVITKAGFITQMLVKCKIYYWQSTISRIESGKPYRVETQKMILLALGLDLSDRDKIFYDANK